VTSLQRKLFSDLKTLRAQVLTIAILVICGVSVLVSSWSSYRSLQNAKTQYYGEFQFADVFAEMSRAPQSILEKIKKIPGVEIAESRVIKDGLVDVSGQVEPALGRFISWNENGQVLNKIYLRQGRMPHAGAQIEVVVHEAFALAHRLKLGDRIKVLLGGIQRTISISGIGLSPEYVYALSPIAPMPDDKHFGIFWIRQRDLESLAGMSGALNSLQMKVAQDFSLSEIKQRLDFILRPYGGLQSYDRSKQMSNMFVEDEIRQQRVMAMVMPTIFLAVAAFILNIVLSRLISLHRAQIATLKSLGYSAWSLSFHYFQFVTVVLFLGIIPALFLGAWIGYWYASMYEDFFRFPSTDFLLSWDSVLVGILSGLIPGWIGSMGALRKVFSMQPAEALRPPSPPRFQSGFLEKTGLAHRLDIYAKMVFRSLFFHPFRLFVSTIGISAALAILINGSFWNDVMDFMIQRQFHEMRREDITVRLNRPSDTHVFSELKQIPGILMAEGERSVGVRLQFQNFKKELSLLGWDSKAQLSQLLDQKGNKIEPRHGGVILSRYFEAEFGLKVGDVIELSELSGEQRHFQVPIMGFVDDLIGQQAYATKMDLHNWLREKPVVDTLQLKIDSSFAENIYVALKNRPEVAGITIRSLLLKSFSDIVADMILTFTLILFLFAIAIAGAVIYNSVRISFSERGWELASLRILGLGLVPTFELLFIEVGVQVLLAMIPGLFLGYFLSFLSTYFIHNDTLKFPLIINLSTYGVAVLVLIGTYLASGVALYFQVKKLDFSQALKARE